MTTPPLPTTEQVAAVVDEAIKASGMTVNRVATLSHVPQPTLKQKLGAARPFTTAELARLAPILGTTVSALIAAAEDAAA